MDRRRAAGALFALAACLATSHAAPTATSNQTALDLYDEVSEGCYYNFQHYGEGDRIMTNEPCLNCTCHNRMLMCYLRVCPFTKAIGQDCTVEKRADQCCPIVTCPDVPVDLLTSTSTSSPAEYGGTGVGKIDKYGCTINGKYFPEGAKVPAMPNKPCEHCYCIRNMTTCVMQECTLHVDGCTPIYHKDVCCPVRYFCDHPEDEMPLLDDMTTTVRPTPGFLLTTIAPTEATEASETTTLPIRRDCIEGDQLYPDGALIKTDKPCQHCYCMKGDIVCVVQECGTPMENEGKNCTSLPPREGQCCPDTYICDGDELNPETTPALPFEEAVTTTIVPPRRVSIEGSGYRNEDEVPYTEAPTFGTELEGSGEEDLIETPVKTTVESEHVDKFGPTDESEFIPKTTAPSIRDESEKATTEPDKGLNTVPSEEEETAKPVVLEQSTSRIEIPVTEPSRRAEDETMPTEKEQESSEPTSPVETVTSKYEIKDTEPSIIEETTTSKIGTVDHSTEPSIKETTPQEELKTTEIYLTTKEESRKPEEMPATEPSIIEAPSATETSQSTKHSIDVEIEDLTEKPKASTESSVTPTLPSEVVQTTSLPADEELPQTVYTRRTLPPSGYLTTSKGIEEEKTESSTIELTTEHEKLDVTEHAISEQNTVPVGADVEDTSEPTKLEKTTLKDEIQNTESPSLVELQTEPISEEVTKPTIFETTTVKIEIETIDTPVGEKEHELQPTTVKEDMPLGTTESVIKETVAEEITKGTTPEDTILATVSPTAMVDENQTATELPSKEPELEKPTSEPIMELSTFAHVTEKESSTTITPETNTAATEKIELPETSTVDEADNEIPPPGRIPGEGDCLLEGVTYKNDSIVPSTNKCHTGCKCVSSIIKCDPIICSSPPEGMDNCEPRYDTPESCCPTYICDHGMETIPPQPQSHITGTESPMSSPAVECNGDQCHVSEDKKESTEPSITMDKASASECDNEGCKLPVQVPVSCTDSKCELPQSSPEESTLPTKEVLQETPVQEVLQSCDSAGVCKETKVPVPCEGDSCLAIQGQLCDKESGCTIEPEIPPPKIIPDLCGTDGECKPVSVPVPAEPSCNGESCSPDKGGCSSGECPSVSSPAQPSQQEEVPAEPSCNGESCSPDKGGCSSGECPSVSSPAQPSQQEEVPAEPSCNGESCSPDKDGCSSGECPSVSSPAQPSQPEEICSDDSGCKKPQVPTECDNGQCVDKDIENKFGCTGDGCIPLQPLSPTQETSFKESVTTIPSELSKETETASPEVQSTISDEITTGDKSTQTPQQLSSEVPPQDITEESTEHAHKLTETPVSDISKERTTIPYRESEIENTATEMTPQDKTETNLLEKQTELPGISLEPKPTDEGQTASTEITKPEPEILQHTTLAETKETIVTKAPEISLSEGERTTSVPLKESEIPEPAPTTAEIPSIAAEITTSKTISEEEIITEAYVVPVSESQEPTSLDHKEHVDQLTTELPEPFRPESSTSSTEMAADTKPPHRTGTEDEISGEEGEPEQSTTQRVIEQEQVTEGFVISESASTTLPKGPEVIEDKFTTTPSESKETYLPYPFVTKKAEGTTLSSIPELDETKTTLSETFTTKPDTSLSEEPKPESLEPYKPQPTTEAAAVVSSETESSVVAEQEAFTEKESAAEPEKTPTTETFEEHTEISAPTTSEIIREKTSEKPYETVEKTTSSPVSQDADQKPEKSTTETEPSVMEGIEISSGKPMMVDAVTPTEQAEIETKEPEIMHTDKPTTLEDSQEELITKGPIDEENIISDSSIKETKQPEPVTVKQPTSDETTTTKVPEQESTEAQGELLEQKDITKIPVSYDTSKPEEFTSEGQFSTHEPQKSSTEPSITEEFETKQPDVAPTEEAMTTRLPDKTQDEGQSERPILREPPTPEKSEESTESSKVVTSPETEQDITEMEQLHTKEPIHATTELSQETATSLAEEPSQAIPESTVTEHRDLVVQQETEPASTDVPVTTKLVTTVLPIGEKIPEQTAETSRPEDDTTKSEVGQEASAPTTRPAVDQEESAHPSKPENELEKPEQTPSPADEEATQTMRPEVEQEQPAQTLSPVGQKEEPTQTAKPDVEPEEPPLTPTPESEQEEPAQLPTTESEHEEPAQTSKPVVEQEEPAQTTKPEEEHEEKTSRPESEQKEPTQTSRPAVEQEEPTQTTRPAVEQEEPTQTFRPAVEKEEPAQTSKPEVEQEEPAQTSSPVGVQDELAQTPTTESEQEEPAQTTRPKLEDEEPTQTLRPESEEAEPAQTSSPAVEQEQPAQTSRPAVEEAEPAQTSRPESEQETTKTSRPGIEHEEPTQTLRPESHQEEPAQTFRPESEQGEPAQTSKPEAEQVEPTLTTRPAVEQEDEVQTTPPESDINEPAPSTVKPEFAPEESAQTLRPETELSETTPYLIELEEHTHKMDVEPSIQPSQEPTTSRLEPAVPELASTESSPSQEPEKEKERPYDHTEDVSMSTEEPRITTVLQEKPEMSSEPSLVDKYGPEEDNKEALGTTHQQPEEISTSSPSDQTEKVDTEKPISADEMPTQTEQPTVKPLLVPVETTAPEEEFIPVTSKVTTTKVEEESPTQPPLATPEEKPTSTATLETPKPEELPPVDEDFPPSGGYNQEPEPDYADEDQAFGPGTCRYGGKVYVSAQQIPRDDPCDFCFCFRSDIICLQQSCPPPIHGCHEEPIQGFCCPRYECPVSMATTLNVTTTTTTTTTTLPPHFLPHAYKGAAQRKGCQIKGHTYQVGEVVRASSGPCLHCTCGGDGQMKCDPKACTPEPMLRQMIAAAVSAKRRR